MSIFHDPDDTWQYLPASHIPVSRWPFGEPCPFVWNGVAWVRWYGRPYSPREVTTYTDISSAFIDDKVEP